jgi:nucleotide-binding universal stress UspA family protein
VFETVVVGSSPSDVADKAFRCALDMARAAGGTLHIVCALEDEKVGAPRHLPEEFRYTDIGAGKTDWLMGQLKARAEAAHVRVATHAVLAPPAEAITRVATEEDADLVVVGTGSSHGARHLTAVPRSVMDRVSCAVMVV